MRQIHIPFSLELARIGAGLASVAIVAAMIGWPIAGHLAFAGAGKKLCAEAQRIWECKDAECLLTELDDSWPLRELVTECPNTPEWYRYLVLVNASSARYPNPFAPRLKPESVDVVLARYDEG